uniref:Uncharacterized protein n=1 Tax=Anguilla anguilla TaxID=7936 RepID=A0A0E9RWA7_ANGAN
MRLRHLLRFPPIFCNEILRLFHLEVCALNRNESV